ncbi:Uma2 family endonuclease [Nostoc sp. UHCC 0252]|uniref:Uma2 family endonuclease n=1 Tax=Nostoc sp. UHCC 0252 TaxID=3110241 RepID=UPI002B20CFEF|nr:Uma2 family endonuclease [Nostoc sp. UHCC 0252]MEA5600695.1 Uma2 family endonuclease [Nostoc sp. UHCC 0252]
MVALSEVPVSKGARAMYASVTQPLTFEEFLAWDDGSGREFELLDGIPVPLSEPNANHEDLIQRLCTYLENHCQENDLPYVSRQSKQVRLKTTPGEKEKSRKADIVIFARVEWQRMKTISSSAAAYIPPPGIIEVVSNNWKDDYLTKLAEYEDLGVFEYIIVDYAAFGGIRFIGSPKQPTITIYQLEDGEYLPPKVFRGEDRIDSRLFPNITLTAEQIFAMSR